MINPIFLAAPLLLAACAVQRPPHMAGVQAASASDRARLAQGLSDQNVPDFAKVPFEPFSRANAVAIALREWRAFGNQVDDDPPGTHVIPDDLRADHQPGFWQRVGEYWWLGQDSTRRQAGWTGKYDDQGTPYAQGDYGHAWSAAFISYIMRTAGANERFRYSPSHADYINAAVRGEAGMQALPAATTPPQVGDLICTGRDAARNIRFENLPAPSFPSHCDLVVEASGGQLTVIGGNVDAGVTMKHIPLSASGTIVDGRYNWFVVLRIPYEA